MPNWVANTVKVEDLNAVVGKFIRKPTQKELEENQFLSDYIVDFNLLKPVPTDLTNTIAGSYEWQTDKYGFGFNTKKINLQNSEIKPILDNLYDNSMTQEEFINAVENTYKDTTNLNKFIVIYDVNTENTTLDETKNHVRNVLKGYYNIRKYGEKNWYDWQVKNWGTKWNGCDTCVNGDDNTISFNTAWSCPIEILQELSKITDVVVSFADEDTGNNYGIFKISKGEIEVILDDTNHSIGESMACRFNDFETIEEDYCEDNYSDEEIQEYFKTDRETLINNAYEDYNKVSNLLSTLI